MGVRHLQQLPRKVSRIRVFISDASRKTQLSIRGNIRSSTTKSSIQSLSFEPLSREDLVPRVMSRLKGRPFMQGTEGDGCPEYLAEPKESLPHAVWVHNPHQASLEELTIKCMEYVEDNIIRTPAILFRNLPAQTAQDFSTIAKAIPWKGLEYKGSPNYRVKADKEAGTYNANDDPSHISIAPHNELSFTNAYPSKVCRILWKICYGFTIVNFPWLKMIMCVIGVIFLKMASTQVVQTSITNNSPPQDSNHLDNHFQLRYVTPGFKPVCYGKLSLGSRCPQLERHANVLPNEGTGKTTNENTWNVENHQKCIGERKEEAQINKRDECTHNYNDDKSEKEKICFPDEQTDEPITYEMIISSNMCTFCIYSDYVFLCPRARWWLWWRDPFA